MIQVVCAIIERGEHVLAACRGPEMRHPWKWEFPGGKVDPGEDPASALHRELQEELSVEVDILEALPPVEHHYDDLHVQLCAYRCAWKRGEPLPEEHAETVWIRPDDLAGLDFAAADLKVIDLYLNQAKPW